MLRLLRESPSLSAVALARRLGKTARTIERYLKSLREAGRVRRVGPTKSGHWEIMKSENG
ncbi:MAG: winged helix-turn-helix transcriptional regulator [Propionibacteriaceae bacterium]|nr:winged helix-turn-helix transcriptional regulator [Propionibacteriaceae bacterium]